MPPNLQARFGRVRLVLRGGGERGSVAVFVAAIVPGLLIVFGLVLDLGQQLRAQRTAASVAQEAARAGSESVDLLSYRGGGGGGVTVNATAAAAAARGYLSAAGYTGTVTLTGPSTLSVSVTVTQPTQVLGLVGIRSWTAAETARARLQEG